MSLHFLVFFTLIFLSYRAASSSQGNETDRLSLIKFKESISSDPYHILDSWNASIHFCNWHGISCGHKHRRVIEFVLQGYQLSGTISPFIGNLSFLRVLVLDNNNFHGEIPQELGLLSRLQDLVIQNNTLTGEFPVNITSCSNLKILAFEGNHLIGKIPMEIGSLHKLSGLYLPRNNFTGEIPTTLWNLTSLSILSLDYNNLEGSIPEEIGRLKNLTRFGVGLNKFSGAIPSALYNLSSLNLITLTSNQFNGSLPANMFSNLPNLQILGLGENQFSGHIPTSIANATMLAVTSISKNNFVGQIPNLGKLHDLSFLSFSLNSLGNNSSKDWEFLNSLSNCSNLENLDLGQNNLGGNLPNTIGNLSTQLTGLTLGGNQICGRIPEALGNLIHLTMLEMALNYFINIIPVTFGKFQNMQFFSLWENKLSGEITHFIGNLTRLLHLDLSNNMLEGQVPSSIGNCESLQYIDLSLNHFSGTIPVQLVALSSLSILLNLSYNSFSGDVTNEVGKLKNIGELDVSHNYFSGSIPQTIGDCHSLEYLLLQGNFFQETIPLSLISLKGLRYLDLSQNNLSGPIPKGLQDIALEYLNISFNMLDGEVPSKGVFGNVSAISLIGNNKLCGGISKLELPPCSIKFTGQSKHQNFKLILSICCVIAFLILASTIAIYHGRKRSNKSSSSSPTHDMIPRVSYQSLHNATDRFSVNNLIGSGSFCSVYKGVFESNEVVAIKVINLQMRGANKSFVAECNALKNTRHRNLVKIISCCSSIDYKGCEFKALVYEYMVNGSLENWLYPRTENPNHHSTVLLLDQVINILIDVASALCYLHHECEQPLVHCDLKPSNVLLDGNMVAHLSDFGLARLLSTAEVISNEHSSTIGIKGTVGYVPPEYGMGSEVSIQGDMYSFGILILEVLTKKRPTEDMFMDGRNLHKYVESAFPNNLLQVVSPTILPIESEHVAASRDLLENMVKIHPNVEKCICCLFRIGLACSMESPQERMSAAEVIRELNSIKRFFLLYSLDTYSCFYSAIYFHYMYNAHLNLIKL